MPHNATPRDLAEQVYGTWWYMYIIWNKYATWQDLQSIKKVPRYKYQSSENTVWAVQNFLWWNWQWLKGLCTLFTFINFGCSFQCIVWYVKYGAIYEFVSRLKHQDVSFYKPSLYSELQQPIHWASKNMAKPGNKQHEKRSIHTCMCGGGLYHHLLHQHTPVEETERLGIGRVSSPSTSQS